MRSWIHVTSVGVDTYHPLIQTAECTRIAG
jgi:hypothetical protein